MNPLVRELYTGAPGLRGTVADGVLRIGESDINHALEASSAAATRVKLEVHDHNRVLARFGLLHATVTLPQSSDLSRSPIITFALASIAVAWALRATLTQPYLRIHGRHVSVDLSAVPALEPYRALLPHVKQVEITTARGVVVVRVHVAVG